MKPQWISARTGAMTGQSPVDAVYGIRIPKGTTIYEGPVAYQGGVHVGGGQQVFVPRPQEIPGAGAVSEVPVR